MVLVSNLVFFHEFGVLAFAALGKHSVKHLFTV